MTGPEPRPLAPPPDPGPAIPIRLIPQEMHSVARRFLAAQDECARIHDVLCRKMAENTQVVGKDASGTKFADAYRKAAETALDGFDRSHRLLGAIGEALAAGAEEHRKADERSTPAGNRTSEPLPALVPHPPPAKGTVVPIGGAAEWWVIAPLDGVYPILEKGKADALSGAFHAAGEDFRRMVEGLRHDVQGLVSNNDSEDLQAFDTYFGRVTNGAVLDGLPVLLDAIDQTFYTYKVQLESKRDDLEHAIKEGLAAAGCTIIVSLIIDVLTEVGWFGVGVEATAAAGAVATRVGPVAIALAGAVDGAMAGTAAGVGVFAAEMASTPDPGASQGQGTSPGSGEPSPPTNAQGQSSVDTRKFSDYVFKEGADHGKDKVFRSLGYGKEHSETLAREYEKQAMEKVARGEYQLGKADQYGQRIDVEIELKGVGESADKVSYLKSGWMKYPDGSIKLNTPFTGFTR